MLLRTSSSSTSFRHCLAGLALIAIAIVAGCGGEAMGDGSPAGAAGQPSQPTGSSGAAGRTGPSTGTGGNAGNAGTSGNAGTAGTPGDAGTTQPDAARPDAAGPMAVPGVASGGKCVPLCANAGTDPDGDGWGFERGVSCIVPGSNVAQTSLTCQIGGPIPSGPPPGTPGVAVDGMCVALCIAAVTDPDGDGWGWQFEAACVMPRSNVAIISMPCSVGGTVSNGTFQGSAGRLLNDACTPFCTSAAADPDGDGFGFQYSVSCIVRGTPAASKGIDCTVGAVEIDPPIVLNPNPPPGQVAKPATVQSRGFFVSGGRLYDKFGNDFVARGINNPHIWFDASDQYLAYGALDNIAARGTNAVRVVWETTGSVALLRRVLRHIVELKMIPMVELHDVTGNTDSARLLDMARYYTTADVKKLLQDYEEFVLVNIANEWSGTDYRNAYSAAITLLRSAGINHTLVIDANGFGQNATSIMNDGAALLAADPQHNLVFSVHMYDGFSARGGGNPKITQTLEQAVSAGLPLVVGEFGWQGGTPPAAIDAGFIMSECARLRLGYFPWSWKGNDANLAYLDLAVDWEGVQLNAWGSQVLQGASGITQSARRASIFPP